MSMIPQERRNVSIDSAEKRIKNRGWVKNAAIVFLAVMLILTFFSNTFMNYSLPEVAAQYTSYSGIKSQIRGSGAVKANSTTTIKMIGTRTIKSVQVKDGDYVEEGQVLYMFEGTEDSSLKTLEKDLYEKEKEYALYKLGAGNTDTRQAYSAKQDQISEEEVKIADSKAAISRLTSDKSITNDPVIAKERAEQEIENLTESIASTDKSIADLTAQLTDSAEVASKRAAYEAAMKSLNLLVADYRAIDHYGLTPPVEEGEEEVIAPLVTNTAAYTQSVSEFVASLRQQYARYENGTEAIDANTLKSIRAILDADDIARAAYAAYYASLGSPSEQSIADGIEFFEDLKSSLEAQKKQQEKIVAVADKVSTQQTAIKASEKLVDSYKKELSTLRDAIKMEEAKGEYDVKD